MSTLKCTWNIYNIFLGCLATQAIIGVGMALQFKAVSWDLRMFISQGLEDMIKVGKATMVPLYCHYLHSPLEPEQHQEFLSLTWCVKLS